MPPSFENLSLILNDPVHYLVDSQEKPSPGELQYCGPHILAVISYAIKLTSDDAPATFSDGLSSLDNAACICRFSWTEAQNFLSLLASFLTEIGEFFVVPKWQQYPSAITLKTVDAIASFIDFLVNVFEILSRPTHSWIIIPGQANILCKRLNLLLAILPDTPFQCTELEERSNILGEIESIANESGNFLYSFFFTTDHVTMTTMDLELSLLLAKLEVVEENIKNHCITIFEEHEFTTLNLPSSSTFIVNSLLDDLNHILNHQADLIVEVKNQITILHDELSSSRSMLKDIELHQNKELIECEMQLIDLAYKVEPIIFRRVGGQAPPWYLSAALPSFIRKSKCTRAKLTNLKLESGIRSAQVVERSREVSSSRGASESIPMGNDIIVGFKEITRQIASQLIGEPNQLQIISIVGMGGSGKTTVATKLYNDSNVRRHFDRRCWCVVSQTYEKKRLMIDILSCVFALNKDELSKIEHHQLADRLYKSLKGNRYLLVVDDIWEKEVWDDLKRYFPDDKNGSKILFTTRNKDAAFDSIINELPLLTNDQCWDLLQAKVFPSSPCPPAFQYIGKKIANNCKRLPITVVGIAAVLANMEKKEVLWQQVATSLSSYNCKHQDILELSYKHLPSHLKPCFLYLGMFKEDEEIPVKKLLSLWISQGFIPRIEDKNPEAIAEDYLLELINRSMVQMAKTRADKGVKTCTIHDLIREMCLGVAEKENFFKMIHEIFKECSINSESRIFGESIPRWFGNFQYHSFIAFCMIRLKILKLSIPDPMIEYDGTASELLVQLRHLECAGTLRNFNNHMKLEFLSLLKPLDTDTQLNMPQLRHLHFLTYQRIPKAWDNSLSNSLQTLSRIMVSDLNDEIRLRHFSHLRRLKCRYGGTWYKRPHIPDLHSLSQLVTLHVAGYLPHDFELFNFPINIKKLSIRSMPVTPKMLLSIGLLPNLEILKMESLPLTELRWDMEDNLFMALKFLKLREVAFNEWNVSEDHFSSLEKLVLIRDYQRCPLPSEFGYIPTLERIETFHCSDIVEMSARKIMEEQEAYGNEKLEVIIHH